MQRHSFTPMPPHDAGDPFCHLPHLRGRLTPADVSALRVTPEVLARFDAGALAMGHNVNWRMPDAQREATRRMLLGQPGACGELWVFGYGSLMWDPGFHFAEVRMAELDGFQRRFSYSISMGRGTLAQPALMLALERAAGCCRGLAFRIRSAHAECESEILWRREMLRGGYTPELHTLRTPQGQVQALVFAANPAHPEYVGELPMHEAAALIARARGPLGSNRAYLEQLSQQLKLLGIDDPYVDALLAQVQSVCGHEPEGAREP